jgi:hypothetical protein
MRCPGFPALFLDSSGLFLAFLFVGRSEVPVYVPAESGSVVFDGDWWARSRVGQQGKVGFLYSHVIVTRFFHDVAFTSRFVPSFLAVCGRLKVKKHVQVYPWRWEAVSASGLEILFQRQRPP